MDQDNLHVNSWMQLHMPRARDRRPVPTGAAPVGGWLARIGGRDSSWDSLWPSLERQTALQTDVDAFCAKVDCGQTTVRQAEHQQLTWFARSAAQAAKMRNLQVSLLEFLANRGWHFSGVKIRTQPAKHPRQDEVKTRPQSIKPGISARPLSYWKALRERLEPGPLRDAVERLIAHHKG